LGTVFAEPGRVLAYDASVRYIVCALALLWGCAQSREPRSASGGQPPPASEDRTAAWNVRWERSANWRPTIFEGKLFVTRRLGAWTGSLKFDQSQASFTFHSGQLEGNHLELAFTTEEMDAPFEVSAWLREGRLIGEAHWGRIPWTPFSGQSIEFPKLRPMHVERGLPVSADGEGAALSGLLANAEFERTSAIVVVKDGSIAAESYREGFGGGPVMAMSASKSIVSLAVGMLIDEGRLSLDTRMDALFPEWKDLGEKSGITVGELLTQTSGLDPSRAMLGESIRAHALKAKLVFTPGTRFQYNNGAVDFLAVVVARAAGVPLDDYLESHLFAPLDIVGATWMKDAEGTPSGAGELSIRPIDLAKIGQLMLDEGRWRGKTIVSEQWVRRSVEPGQTFDGSCGLLWWREGPFAHAVTAEVVDGWRDAGVEDATTRAARSLIGTRFKSRPLLAKALERLLGPAAMANSTQPSRGGTTFPLRLCSPMDPRADSQHGDG
jgi:CubicO group peptidase (beta-lactamase class C family)